MLGAGRGNKKYKKKGNRRSGTEPIFSFLRFSSILSTSFWALNKEGAVGAVTKPGMAELSVLTTHCLTYSIISSLRAQINFGLSASSAYPTEFSAPLILLNVKSPSTDLPFTILPLAMWAEGTDHLSMAACGVKVTPSGM